MYSNLEENGMPLNIIDDQNYINSEQNLNYQYQANNQLNNINDIYQLNNNQENNYVNNNYIETNQNQNQTYYNYPQINEINSPNNITYQTDNNINYINEYNNQQTNNNNATNNIYYENNGINTANDFTQINYSFSGDFFLELDISTSFTSTLFERSNNSFKFLALFSFLIFVICFFGCC